MEKQLSQLVEKLKAAAGPNLRSVVLYGSAVAGDFHPKHSDLNVLCVVNRLDAIALEKLNPVVHWWARRGHSGPLVFALEELQRSADIFAIELLDIKVSRRVLDGEDVFAGLEVPMSLHRLQVERELKANLIRLRQRYLAGSHTARSLLGLMTASVSSFAALFRHALIALGEPAPSGKREAVDRLAAVLGFDPAPFHHLLDVREERKKEAEVDVVATFRAYLGAIQRVADEVDRRFAASAGQAAR